MPIMNGEREQIPDFIPAVHIRNPFIQSFLSSRRPFRESSKEFDRGRFILMNTKEESILSGFYSENVKREGLIILIHGWEGSCESAYVLRSASYFYKAGYSIFRLNLRDHGNTQGLNQKPFNGTLLSETYEAVSYACNLNPDIPAYILGFSLGGNFSLRIAKRFSTSLDWIPNLKAVFTVSPSVNPKKATAKIDSHVLLRKYFLKHWLFSLQRKSLFFPDYFKLESLVKAKSVMDLTERLVLEYTSYKSLDEYFGQYTIEGEYFKNLALPVYIIASLDDPVIPAEDFYHIKPNAHLHLIMREFGGHNGFFETIRKIPWYLPVFRSIIENLKRKEAFV